MIFLLQEPKGTKKLGWHQEAQKEHQWKKWNPNEIWSLVNKNKMNVSLLVLANVSE